MGVHGLKSFLERNGRTRPVNIVDEIQRWKSKNSGKTPTIVFDFCSLRKRGKNKKDCICGGVREITSNPWNEIFKNLKAAGCELIFFSDQRVKHKDEKSPVETSEYFGFYTDLYDRIDDQQTLQEISDEWMPNFEEASIYRELAAIASKYGEYRISVNEECDLELAQYASNNNALAVVSNDTDFLIYEGAWQLWWTAIDMNLWNELKTTEYVRKDLEDLCSLSRNQLPLFATLLGSHFTSKYRNIFHGFHRIKDVANYVRKVGNCSLSDFDIKRIQEAVYKDAEQSANEIRQSIRNSLEWFNINSPAPILDDKLAETFLIIRVNGVDMFRPYMRNMGKCHAVLARYYDLRGSENGTNLIMLMMEWQKRRSGVLRQRFHDDTFDLTIWAITDVNAVSELTHIERPIFPDFEVPPLEDLYHEDDTEITEIRWKIFSWIMSLSADVISKIKNLPNNVVLISTVLSSLVQNGLVSELEADGILYTEYKFIDNESEMMSEEYPTVLVSRHVRAVHIYRAAFISVEENFAIAGLLSLYHRSLNFYGVYYQNLMAQLHQMDDAQRETFIAPIKQWRTYVLNH
ncbi:uncharacterized protein LOC119069206 [Bradysia coprophila]|uniref:uncharacterized protein LOC119069206 n=1 Tax=Bradysia coprophila TaxID=38358 RepID=UPI00187DC7FC|nr:uncharacterized protein LOC119069206 [Bradysia coprophila]